ncbi:MAG: DUF4280 domain-containing protein [Bacteroidaceae bacterium]|nr:DUF4280 domain-containing protein [Bacteroidaceae bacterium]
MGTFVTMGAMLKCSFGMAPGTLMVLDPTRPRVGNMFAANIMDFAPMSNILPFGMCQSMSNPTVASATAAACGVLTPMPCIPVIAAPWAPGSPMVKVSHLPALINNCKCFCAWGGCIEVTNPGHTTIAKAQ